MQYTLQHKLRSQNVFLEYFKFFGKLYCNNMITLKSVIILQKVFFLRLLIHKFPYNCIYLYSVGNNVLFRFHLLRIILKQMGLLMNLFRRISHTELNFQLF